MIIEIRKHLQSMSWFWYTLVLMFIVPPLVQAFQIFRSKADSVALVNGYPIKQKEFFRVKQGHEAYVRQLISYGLGQFARQMSDQEILKMCAQGILEEKIAEKIGIEIPMQELAEELAKGGAQHAVDQYGKFDASRYALSVTSSSGMTVGDYEQSVAKKMQTDALHDFVSFCGYKPLFVGKFEEQNKKTEKKFKVIKLENADFVKKSRAGGVVEAELEAFFQANINQYLSDPWAEISYAELDKSAFLNLAQPDEYDLQDFYEQHLRSRFIEAEKYTVNYAWTEKQEALENKEDGLNKKELEEFVAAVKNGKSFEALAKKSGFNVEKKELVVNQNQLPLALEVAIRELSQPGELSRIVEDGNKLYVSQVVSYTPSTTKPFDAVRDQISEEVKQIRLNQIVREEIEGILLRAREQEAGDEIFKDYVQKNSLKTKAVKLTKGQKGLSSLESNLLQATLTSNLDQGAIAYTIDNDKTYIFTVDAVALARPQPLEAVQKQVENDFFDSKGSQETQVLATALHEKLLQKINIEKELADNDLQVIETEWVDGESKKIKGFDFNYKVIQKLQKINRPEQVIEQKTDKGIFLLALAASRPAEGKAEDKAFEHNYFNYQVGQEVVDGFGLGLLKAAKIEPIKQFNFNVVPEV